jgi:pimeloyl-ACP methyl ester carboxylesterase
MIMNRLIVFLALCCLTFVCSAQEFKVMTQEIVQLLEQNKMGKVHSYFDKKTKKSFKKIYLIAAWRGIQKNNGKLRDVGEVAYSSAKNRQTATVPLHFEKASFNLVLTGNEKKEIAGLRFTALAYQTPPWAKNRVFGKERIKVKTDTFTLPGELLLPESCNQCPVVILVHGSGPSDRNEGSSLTPNRLFQDLAYGFAINGIATIRYDKRTLVYQKQLTGIDSFTLYDETIADAVTAVNLAKSYPFLDSSAVYVLGHSLGAYASPRIANKSDVAGIIMLAGPYRPLYEIIPEQYAFLLGLDGKLTKKETKLIETTKEEVKFINKEKSTVSKLSVMGNDQMLHYFRDLSRYDPADMIKQLDCRVLVTQGDRDYQVRYQTEFIKYQDILQHESHVDFYLIPGVNHQLIWGSAPSTPNEYYIPGHPSLDVIKYLAGWVNHK